MKTMKKAQKRKRLEALTKSLMLQRSSLKTLTKALKISPRPCSDLTRPVRHLRPALGETTLILAVRQVLLFGLAPLQKSLGRKPTPASQRPDSTGKASKASARRNNTDISRAPSSPIRPAPLQKSPASQHSGDASAHATAFEPEDSDQGSEDFYGTMQRPDSTGKASKASARRNNTDISRAPIASSPIRLAPLQKSLGRKATPASQVKHLPASQHPGDASAHAPCSPSSPITRSQSRRTTATKQNDKNSLPDHPELIDVSKIALKDLPQMLSDESYSTIALVILGCKTKAYLGNKIGKYATDLKTLSHRKAFNTKPLDEKIRMVVEDSIWRNLVSLQGRAARQEGKLILERANVKFTAHLAF
ncbi:hypothetical protein R1sor_008171 [Riccia sorocarpa]|uniref:Uncharacterized protein n=1 Tax=Riccia sorocarpa TaxID=122646 RepID=A0ABD3HWN5_9MARC